MQVMYVGEVCCSYGADMLLVARCCWWLGVVDDVGDIC